MLTFQDQYKMAQRITGDTSDETLADFKRDINEGGISFLNALGRKFNREYRKTSTVAGQQYYQMPQDVLRPSTIQVSDGNNLYTPQLVTSDQEWNDLNFTQATGGVATHCFVRGFNEIGLYPIPSQSIGDGLQVSYEPNQVYLSKDDFSTDTVSVENGSTTVTHSATAFTGDMVGRWFSVTDGTDTRWYKIASVDSSSSLTLENFYMGTTGSGKSFKIGEIMKIPDGYQDAPVFFALERYYLMQGDKPSADSYNARFDKRLRIAKKTYGKSTSQQGVRRTSSTRLPNWIDLTPPVQYP